MKINGNYHPHVKNIYQQQQPKRASKDKGVEQKTPVKDRLQLSPQAKQIQELVKMVGELPETREKKVAQIKEKLTDRTYHVPAAQVAVKILSEK